MLRVILTSLAPIVLFTTLCSGERLQLEGELECVGAEGPMEFSNPCQAGSELHFRATSGKVYRFEADDPRGAIFEDQQVRGRRIQLTAEVDPSGALSLLSVYTYREGRLVEPHYFCSVCNITAYAPGPCWCCQREFEYRERDVSQPNPKGVLP